MNTIEEALREWREKQEEAKKQKHGLPKRNPDRDTSKIGYQKVRLNPKRHDWNAGKRDRAYWNNRASKGKPKP